MIVQGCSPGCPEQSYFTGYYVTYCLRSPQLARGTEQTAQCQFTRPFSSAEIGKGSGYARLPNLEVSGSSPRRFFFFFSSFFFFILFYILFPFVFLPYFSLFSSFFLLFLFLSYLFLSFPLFSCSVFLSFFFLFLFFLPFFIHSSLFSY